MTAKGWNLQQIDPPIDNDKEQELLTHFSEELPYYLSIALGNPVFIIFYKGIDIVKIKKYCMKDRKVEYKDDGRRLPLFIGATLGKTDYHGLRCRDGDYLHHIKSFMSLERKTELNKEEFSYACLLYTSPSPRDRTRSRMPSSA